MKRCFNLIPPRFADGRHEAIERGLARHGFTIARTPPHAPTARDIVCTWNCHADYQQDAAALVRKAGGRHILAEEAYTRWTWPVKHFALSLDAHNGAGRWFVGGPERWEKMGLDVRPWRADAPGARIVVREQRGIGTPQMRSPPAWHERTCEALRRASKRPVQLRRHPALQQPVRVPAEEELEGAHALVTWASSDAVRALIMGVPVFFAAPHIVVEGACKRLASLGGAELTAEIEAPLMDDQLRLDALRRMAWAQWEIGAIERGEPFEHLLSV